MNKIKNFKRSLVQKMTICKNFCKVVPFIFVKLRKDGVTKYFFCVKFFKIEKCDSTSLYFYFMILYITLFLFYDQAIHYFASLDMHVYFKDRNKKTFTKTKEMIAEIKVFLETKKERSYADFMLNTFFDKFKQSAALCGTLKDLWDKSSIVCLDCDDLTTLFMKHQKENQKILQNLFLFLVDAKQNGLVVFRSPTNSPFDRFKVFVKIRDFCGDYKKIQNRFKDSKMS